MVRRDGAASIRLEEQEDQAGTDRDSLGEGPEDSDWEATRMERTVLRDPRFDRELLALPEKVRDSCGHVIAALRRRPRRRPRTS